MESSQTELAVDTGMIFFTVHKYDIPIPNNRMVMCINYYHVRGPRRVKRCCVCHQKTRLFVTVLYRLEIEIAWY